MRFRKIFKPLIVAGILLVFTACSMLEQTSADLPDDASPPITDNPENVSTAIDMDVPSQPSESEVQSNTGTNGGTQTETALETASVPSTLGRFQAVLTGEADFVDAFSQEIISISNVASVFTTDPSTIATVETFSILDCDGDGLTEVVLRLGPNETFGFLILREQGEEIYGYWVASRAMQDLKEDGTFTISSGAGSSGIGTLSFGEQTCETTEFAYSEARYDAEGNPVVYYSVDGQEVSQETFEQKMEQQAQKKDAAAYEFTAANIQSCLNS